MKKESFLGMQYFIAGIVVAAFVLLYVQKSTLAGSRMACLTFLHYVGGTQFPSGYLCLQNAE